MTRVAVIDVGTVTARLAIADVESGRVAHMDKQSQIVNLGEDVDKTGLLKEEACRRLLACVDEYLSAVRRAGIRMVCCTLTSASRDARNSSELLREFDARGLSALVIPGQVEGSLTFLGVAQDFVGVPLLVADNGGGSTEFAAGKLDDGGLHMEFVRSIDVGCRRVTEKFLANDGPAIPNDLAAAHAFAAGEFERVTALMAALHEQPRRLVVTGGTATTLVALEKRLVPYDSEQVHLAALPREAVRRQEARLAALDVAGRASLAGIQPKRAPVILGGVVAIVEAMRATGFDVLTVSESDLLFGLSLVVAATMEGRPSPVGWKPELR